MSISESGQPKTIYSHPKDFSEVLRSKMGGLDGKILYHHNLQWASTIMDILETVETAFDTGLMVTGAFDQKKPITTKYPDDVVDRLKKIWYYGWYNIVTYDKFNPENIVSEEVSVYYPQPNKLNDYTEVLERPALKNMIPREDISGNWGVTIQGLVKVNDAFRYTRYTDVVMKGKFYTEYDDKTIPDFKSQIEIKNSIDYTIIVPQEWYDRVMDMIFPFFRKDGLVVYALTHKMMNEMDAFNTSSGEDETEEKQITELQ